jgi:hypothetical protein
MKVMEAEHCSKAGSKKLFKTTNYRLSTCPELEWNIVVAKAKCPPENMIHNRRIPDVAMLLKLHLSKEAKLTEAEVISVVLYSGPMVSSGCPCRLFARSQTF